jgi:fatty-acyl-CoA synthase
MQPNPAPLADATAPHLTNSCWPADVSRPLHDWSIPRALREVAAEVPDRVALVEGVRERDRRRRWTYQQLVSDVERLAAALLETFEPRERIAVWGPNVPEWELLQLGIHFAGMTLVTVNPAYRARELEYVLRLSEAAGLFVVDAYRGHETLATAREVGRSLPKLRKIVRFGEVAGLVGSATQRRTLPEIRPDEPCTIMFTSGTTGAQKGALLHGKGLVNMAAFTQERGGLEPGGVYVNAMPLFHIGGSGHGILGSIMRRATHVLAPAFEPALFLELVESERGTYSLLVPTMIEALLAFPDRSRFDLSTFRSIVSGASVVEASLIRRTLAELRCTIGNIYGQTEVHGVVTATSREDSTEDQSETIGRPLPHVEVKIADPVTGRILPIGAQGEICARGYQTMAGYFNMPAETAKTLRSDGWIHTGDLGSMEARGYLRITGRLKDMIIRGGENIYPREVENLLLEHPKVASVAVVGVPDNYWGEQVGAVVIAKAEGDRPTAAELHDFCRARLAAFKTPKLWYFCEEFPWTLTGKVQKFKLRDLIVRGELIPHTVASAPHPDRRSEPGGSASRKPTAEGAAE